MQGNGNSKKLDYRKVHVIDKSFFIGSEGAVHLYSIDGKKLELYEHKDSPYDVTSIAYSDNNNMVVSGGRRGAVSVWPRLAESIVNTETESQVLKVVSLQFLGRNIDFVGGALDGTLALYNYSGKLLKKVSAHSNELFSIVTSKGEHEVMTVGDESQLRVWSDSLQPLSSITIPSPGRVLRFFEDQSSVVVFTENGELLSMPVTLPLLYKRICKIREVKGKTKPDHFCD